MDSHHVNSAGMDRPVEELLLRKRSIKDRPRSHVRTSSLPGFDEPLGDTLSAVKRPQLTGIRCKFPEITRRRVLKVLAGLQPVDSRISREGLPRQSLQDIEKLTSRLQSARKLAPSGL